MTIFLLHAGFAPLLRILLRRRPAIATQSTWKAKPPPFAYALFINEFKRTATGHERSRLEGPGSTDKPLGDAGSGVSGGGSLGNKPGPGAATGSDPAQGVRQPTSGEANSLLHNIGRDRKYHLSREQYRVTRRRRRAQKRLTMNDRLSQVGIEKARDRPLPY